MSQPNFKSSATSDVFWLRTIYTVIFLLVAKTLDLLLITITLTQWLFRLFSGDNQKTLKNFSFSLGMYYQQVTHYLTGCSEEKPFPFKEWPGHDHHIYPDKEKNE